MESAVDSVEERAPVSGTPGTSWAVTMSEDEALGVIGHLLSSAELCLFEPELYGTFRLLDATSRFLGTLLSKDPANHDPFLAGLKQEIDTKKVWMMYDRDGFRDFVREVPVRLATRLMERSQAVEEGV